MAPLRSAMAAANVRRPLDPLPFVAATLRSGQPPPGDASGSSGSGSGSVDAFSYIETYETELAGALVTCLAEDEDEGGKSTQRLAELLGEAA